jgi:hypothetical protein
MFMRAGPDRIWGETMSTRLLTRPWRYILAALILALCTWVLVARWLTPPSARARPAQAAGVVVTTCTPQGLADAMNTLNGTSGGSISFNCNNVNAPTTIPITQAGGFNVTANSSYTIDGGNVITLTGIDTYRILNVQAGGALTLTHILLTHGYAAFGGSFPTQGGALLNNGGRLVLDHTTVRDSQSSFAGGAIETAAGTTILIDSLIENNQSPYGGGIDSIGTLALIRTTVRNNHALTNTGGGLDVGGTVVIRDSQIVSNTADANNGGGMYLANLGTATVDHSLIASNIVTPTVTGAGGGIYSQGTLTLTHVTLSDNHTGGGDGGALYIDSMGRADIRDSQIISNSGKINPHTPAGGGIYNASNFLTIRQTALNGNSAYLGGGIDNDGMMTLTNDTFGSNAAHHGGGLANSRTAILTDVTLNDNAASTDGGGIINYSMLTVTNATLSGNSAPEGGGMQNSGTVTVRNSTFSGNSALAGGGIANRQMAALSNVTFYSNTATNGGGIYHSGIVASQSISVENSIVAYSPSGGNCYVNPGSASGSTIISLGYNLSSDFSCQVYFNQATDLPPSTDPNLGPLANHGGPTLTHMPLTPDSPGIDVIPKFTNGCGTTITTDQRGAPRPINGQCDIGAVEYGAKLFGLYVPLILR